MAFMLTNSARVPTNCANWRAKWVLPMPGGPSNNMGISAKPSSLSWLRANWRLTSSKGCAKLGKAAYKAAMSGTAPGLAQVRKAPRCNKRS
jgi:hypothetical protein